MYAAFLFASDMHVFCMVLSFFFPLVLAQNYKYGYEVRTGEAGERNEVKREVIPTITATA